jgi:predicted TIM-barrel fold metal-dependent hydrolase
MAKGDAARIRASLDHPVIDADGHWIESPPVFFDYLKDTAGHQMVEAYHRSQIRQASWYAASESERQQKRIGRRTWWITTANTLDFASGMMPGLFVDRMSELGIDYGVIYPTRYLLASHIVEDELRRAMCRAYNRMAADVFAPYAARLTPVAMLPCHTPDEAIDELEYATGDLGLKAAVFRGSIQRPVPAYLPKNIAFEGVPDALNDVAYYIDALGLDNPYDYDPLWQKCLDLRVAVTVHQISNGWSDRRSVSNGEFNRVGHIADAHASLVKSLFLGGVVRRFPGLTFSFLEGGVAFGAQLLANLIGGWDKRRHDPMLAHLRPTNLDTEELRRLIDRYGYAALKSKGEDAIGALQLQALTDREKEPLDDYARLDVNSKSELIELYQRNFYFGCEADDPGNAWAFDARMPGRLKAILGSDVSHYDVTDFTEVMPEVWELVEDGLLTAQDLREFVFSNAVEAHGRVNPDFFKGTVVEHAAEAELKRLSPVPVA